MKLTIVGAGAIGGTIGAHMIRAGHDVLLCDADPDHVAAIRAHGLRIEGPVEQFTVPARAVTPDELPDRIEHAAIAVKQHHTASAAAALQGRIAEGGDVVSFQNGLTTDRIAAAVGADKVLTSFVNFGADVLAPGVVLQGNVATFRVGEPYRREITDRVRALADALPYAEPTDNIMGFLWGKEAYGAMLWAGAVSDLSIADSLADPRFRPLMLAIAREVLDQAPVTPEAFDGFDPADLEGSLDRLVTFNRNSAKSHSGIYRDLMVRRRPTEVDGLLDDLGGPLTTYVGRLVQAIERGERTCEVANLELLAAYEVAERLGRPLGALVSLLPAPPRAGTGPLAGMPVAVKDLIDVAGHPRGNGNPRDMAGPPAAHDAPVVARLRAAGAEVFATTALLEYAAGALHPEVPETRNPFDPGRTAGGSSGGSAALVAVGACPVALGTDTGGSVRLPAHYCGVVGLKPTADLLPLDGVQPLAPSLDHVGLLAVDVAHLGHALAALTGAPPLPTAPAPLRLGVLERQLADPAVTGEVAGVLAAAIARLGSLATLVEVDDQALRAIDPYFDDLVLYEAWQVHRSQVDREPDRYGPDTLRLLRAGSAVSRSRYEHALERRHALLPAARTAPYAGVDAVVGPAAPFAAPVTTPPIDTPEGDAEGRFSRVYNLTGAPALSLPCGWTAGGLPVGIQLSTPPGHDRQLLAVAAALESALGFTRPEPGR